MFIEKIENSNCVIPEAIMHQYTTSNKGPDDSLIMTSLMLLYSRELHEIDIKEDYGSAAIIPSGSSDTDKNVYTFHIYRYSEVSNLDNFVAETLKNLENTEALPEHEKFLSEKLNSPIRIRLLKEYNTVFFYTQTWTPKICHAMQFFIPCYFKTFEEYPLTADEKKFLKALTANNYMLYEAEVRKLAKSKSFQEFTMKQMLHRFEKDLFEGKVAATKNEIKNIERDMESLMSQYKLLCDRKLDARARLEGFTCMADRQEEATEFQDYILNNKNICGLDIEGSHIKFIAKTVLVPYYIDDYEKFAKHNTYFTRFNSSQVPNLSDRKIIFDAIFSSKRELKLRMCAYFDLDYFGSKVDSMKHFSFTAKDSSLKDYVPNPHLDNYNCFEDNRPPILEQLNMGDPIGAIECCIACAQRVNIHESINFDPFGKAILDHKGKILVTNDGREMTVLEALEYLKGKQNAENG